MRLHAGEHRLAHPWEAVTAAAWLKYPSELAPHVEHVDYAARRVDAHGRLVTTRVLVCRQAVPSVLLPVVRALHAGDVEDGGLRALFVERSVVDVRARSATSVTRNVTLARFLSLRETIVYEPEGSASGSGSSGKALEPDATPSATGILNAPESPNGTVMRQEAAVTASLPGLWGALRDAVEVACVARFRANAHRGRAALEAAAARAVATMSSSEPTSSGPV